MDWKSKPSPFFEHEEDIFDRDEAIELKSDKKRRALEDKRFIRNARVENPFAEAYDSWVLQNVG